MDPQSFMFSSTGILRAILGYETLFLAFYHEDTDGGIVELDIIMDYVNNIFMTK